MSVNFLNVKIITLKCLCASMDYNKANFFY